MLAFLARACAAATQECTWELVEQTGRPCLPRTRVQQCPLTPGAITNLVLGQGGWMYSIVGDLYILHLLARLRGIHFVLKTYRGGWMVLSLIPYSRMPPCVFFSSQHWCSSVDAGQSHLVHPGYRRPKPDD